MTPAVLLLLSAAAEQVSADISDWVMGGIFSARVRVAIWQIGRFHNQHPSSFARGCGVHAYSASMSRYGRLHAAERWAVSHGLGFKYRVLH